MFKTKMITCR